jgi:hypothetical protein
VEIGNICPIENIFSKKVGQLQRILIVGREFSEKIIRPYENRKKVFWQGKITTAETVPKYGHNQKFVVEKNKNH